jgi:hypothetical protein
MLRMLSCITLVFAFCVGNVDITYVVMFQLLDVIAFFGLSKQKIVAQ